MFQYNSFKAEDKRYKELFKYTICSSITTEDDREVELLYKFKYTICSSITLNVGSEMTDEFIFKYTICSSITHTRKLDKEYRI